MPLARSRVNIPLIRGIDESVDKALGDSSLGLVENMEFDRLGRLSRRRGSVTLAAGRKDGRSSPNGYGIYGGPDGVRWRTENTLLELAPDAAASRAVGGFQPMRAKRMSVAKGLTVENIGTDFHGLRYTDLAVMSDGKRGIATWVSQVDGSPDTAMWAMVNPDDGSVLSPPQAFSPITPSPGIAAGNGWRSRCIATRQYLCVVHHDGSGALVVSRVSVGVSGLTSTTITMTTLTLSRAPDSLVWEACAWDATDPSQGDDLVLAYRDTVSGNLEYARIDGASLAETSASTNAIAGGPIRHVAVRSMNSIVAVAWSAAAQAIKVETFNSAGTALGLISLTLAAGDNARSMGFEVSHDDELTSLALLVRYDDSVAPRESTGMFEMNVTALTSSILDTVDWLNPRSIPWRVGTRLHFLAHPPRDEPTRAFGEGLFDVSIPLDGDENDTTFLAEFAVSGKLSAGTRDDPEAAVTPTEDVRLYGVSRSTDSSAILPVDSFHVGIDEQTRLSLTPESVGAFHAVAYSLRYGGPDVALGVQVGDDLVIAGGVPGVFDGVSYYEAGVQTPTVISAVAGAGGSGALTAGDYQWRLVCEWTDYRGRVHRSPPSDPILLTAAASGSAVITVCRTNLNGHWTNGVSAGGDMRVALYRTAVGGGASGIMYRVDSELSGGDGTAGLVLTDATWSDTAIEDNEVLYTAGGVLESDIVPAGGAVAVHKERAWVKGNYQDTRLYYSKSLLAGRPIEFNLATFFDVLDGGEITGLASYNDVLLVFKKRAIYGITGTGPSDTGLPANAWNLQRIDESIGCVNAATVVVTPAGVIFESERGFMVVDQGFGVRNIGEPVRRHLQENTGTAVCYGAAVDTARSLARWVFPTSGKASVEYCYNYEFKTWTVNSSTLSSIRGIAAFQLGGADSGGFLYVADSGRVLGEYGYDDVSDANGAFVQFPMSIETNWLTFDQFDEGYKRVWFVHMLGEWLTAHDVVVTCESEHGAATRATTHSFLDSESFGSLTEPYDLRVHLRHQHGNRFRFTFTFTDRVGHVELPGGAIAVLHSLAFDVGTMPGLNNRAGGTGRGR